MRRQIIQRLFQIFVYENQVQEEEEATSKIFNLI